MTFCNFFASASVTVRGSEVSSVRKLIILLCDIFWNIDDHHHAFEQQAQAIPSVFDYSPKATTVLSVQSIGKGALETSLLISARAFT